MAKKFLSGINVTGSAALNTVADAGSNTDKFLVLDSSNVVSYRTASELYADLGIGSLPAGYTSTLKHEVKAGQTISKGQAVYVSSADGTNMIVTKASNASEATSSKTMGLLETSLTTNGKGNVITEGLLTGLNTNGATAGDPVWLGVDGALIFGLANKPVAPAHLVFIGIVTRANPNNGEIFVKVQNGFEMNEIHNYQQGSVQNNEVIVYESSTSLYKPKSIPTILGYTPVTNARTLTINGTSYDLSEDRSWTISANLNARTEYEFTTDGSSATYNAVYSVGQVDVFYNGSKLSSAEFTATNGTSVTLGFTPPNGQSVEIVAWETGGGVASGRTLTINGTTYDLSANRSWTITDSSKLPLSGGTLTGALGGTSATFSGSVTSAGVIFTSNNTPFATNGSITNHSVVGLVSKATTGSIFDWSIYGTSGNALLVNPTGTDNIAFLTGNFGIGTSSPANTLDVQTSSGVGSSTASGLARFITAGSTTAVSVGQANSARRLDIASYQINVTGEDFYLTNNGANAIIFGTNFSERLRITSGGAICIGGTGSGEKLNITSGNQKFYTYQYNAGQYTYIGTEYAQGNGNNKAEIRFGIESDTYTFLSFATAAGGGSINERMRITSGGNVCIGGADPLNNAALTLFAVNGSTTSLLSIKANNASGSNASIYLEAPGVVGGGMYLDRNTSTLRVWQAGSTNGVQLTNNATSWGSFSDERLKTDLVSIDNAIEKIINIRAVTGRYKTDNAETSRSFLIAQDVQKVFPEAVEALTDEIGTLSLRYTDIIPVLVKAIQEQQLQIEELKSRLN